MLELKRKHVETNSDLREDPRIEFHLPATIIGIEAKANIVDFSLGGFYIETDAPNLPEKGQRLNIALKLPSETTGITVKAEVVYQTSSGFGCKLCDPAPDTLRALERCFDIFSSTLPVGEASHSAHRTFAA